MWKRDRKIILINTGASISNTFGKGVGQVHISRFYCSGSESQLLSCGYYIYSCNYSYHAGIKCEGIDHKILIHKNCSHFYSTMY